MNQFYPFLSKLSQTSLVQKKSPVSDRAKVESIFVQSYRFYPQQFCKKINYFLFSRGRKVKELLCFFGSK